MRTANEFKERVKSLCTDGYRVQVIREGETLSFALLVHHNGNRVRLTLNRKLGYLTQRTNNVKTFELHETETPQVHQP